MSWFNESLKRIKTMSLKSKTPAPTASIRQHILRIGGIAVVLIILTLFCYLAEYPLIIPLVLFFSAWHLKITKSITWRMMIHLGLMLTLILFIAHTLSFYTNVSLYYVPVAGIAMLTMLLFNSLTFMFTMTFLSSLLVTLVATQSFAMFLIFFAYGTGEAQANGFIPGFGKDMRKRG